MQHTREKRTIVQESYLAGMSLSLVATKYGISPSQLFKWRRLMEDGAIQDIRAEEGVVPRSQVKELERRIVELERVLGRSAVKKNSSRGSRI